MSRRKGVYKLTATSQGQTMAEYALILATIALISTALVQNAGAIINTLTNRVVNLFG
jgi:Flp pilus assembly pilin Flp